MTWLTGVLAWFSTSVIGKFFLDYFWTKFVKWLYKLYHAYKDIANYEKENREIRDQVEGAKTDEEKQAAADRAARDIGRKP